MRSISSRFSICLKNLISKPPSLYSVEDTYVQNVCRNYFKLETSKNRYWIEIAREYWIDFLKDELDMMFHREIPILMTTEFILNASLIDSNRSIKAEDIYTNNLAISENENLFSREMIALYRHPKYSLTNWPEYREFIKDKLP